MTEAIAVRGALDPSDGIQNEPSSEDLTLRAPTTVDRPPGYEDWTEAELREAWGR